MAIATQPSGRGLGKALLLLVLCGLVVVCGFVGLMIATAGVAVHPPLARVAAPLACEGEFVTQSRSYSYKPGQRGTQINFYCEQPDGARKDITLRTMFYAFGVYSVVAFAVGLVALVPVSWFFTRHARKLRGPMARAVSRMQAGVVRAQPAAATRIVVDGQEYDSVDDLPPAARSAYAQAMQSLAAVGIGTPGDQAADPGGDVAERLRKLQALRDAGLITRQDYETKKADILSRL